LTGHNFTISKQEGIWIFAMVVWSIVSIFIIFLTLLLFNNIRTWVVELMINGDVHLFNQDAISWDSVTLLKIDNISDNELGDWNFLNGSISTSVDTNLLVVDFFPEVQEVSFLLPVTETCDDADKHKSGVNG
jgi:hypothetical protein